MVVSTNNLSNSASLTGWFLNQKSLLCMNVCACVCVYASEVINNQWHDFDFI